MEFYSVVNLWSSSSNVTSDLFLCHDSRYINCQIFTCYLLCLQHYLQGTDVEQLQRCTIFCMCKQVNLYFCLGFQSFSVGYPNLFIFLQDKVYPFNILEDNLCCICLVVLLGTLKSRNVYSAMFFNRLQKLTAEFSGEFDCSCFSVWLYVAYYALQSVLQPLYPYVYLNANAQTCLCAIF